MFYDARRAPISNQLCRGWPTNSIDNARLKSRGKESARVSHCMTGSLVGLDLIYIGVTRSRSFAYYLVSRPVSRALTGHLVLSAANRSSRRPRPIHWFVRHGRMIMSAALSPTPSAVFVFHLQSQPHHLQDPQRPRRRRATAC